MSPASPRPESRVLLDGLFGSDGRTVFERLGGGRNSRVFLAESPGHPSVVVKEYTPDFARRGTFERETSALKRMERHGIENVPRLLASDPVHGIVVLSRLAGVPTGTPTEEDAFAPFLDFLRELQEIPLDASTGWARDASTHPLALIDQIQERCARFPLEDKGLRDFLEARLLPAFREFSRESRRILEEEGIGIGPIPERSRILSPSDFGFHNTLRKSDGSLCFLDFEFFGQDDPAKLLSDMLLHPAMRPSPSQKDRLVSGFTGFREADAEFPVRFHAIYPLCGVKWCCIALNEFVPSDNSRRLEAVDPATPRSEVLERQLYIAGSILDNIWQNPAPLPETTRGPA